MSPNRRRAETDTLANAGSANIATTTQATSNVGTSQSNEGVGKKRKNIDFDGSPPPPPLPQTHHTKKQPHQQLERLHRHPASVNDVEDSNSVDNDLQSSSIGDDEHSHENMDQKDDTCDSSSGAEENVSDDASPTHDDSSGSSESKGKVLGDLSNRKSNNITRRSTRKIKPVIKKASAIPAPRRGPRRLQHSHQ